MSEAIVAFSTLFLQQRREDLRAFAGGREGFTEMSTTNTVYGTYSELGRRYGDEYVADATIRALRKREMSAEGDAVLGTAVAAWRKIESGYTDDFEEALELVLGKKQQR